MNLIYHEKQEGSLCAQHCLNNLLQGEYFSAVDLAEIAQQMDQEEQYRMAEHGTNTDDFQKFIKQPSSNMDDSGMFSVQVLSSALKIWDLSIVPFGSSNSLAKLARNDPVLQSAYICNFKEHWLTVRKLGHQWFNLNSLLTFPELISDTYLSLFLTQLQHEGYSIFVLEGLLPPCKADDALKLSLAEQTVKPQLLSEVDNSSQSKEHQQLKAALSASLAKAGCGSGTASTSVLSSNSSDGDLRRALRMSLEEPSVSHVSQNQNISDDESEIQKAISLSLEQSDSSTSGHSELKEKSYPVIKNESSNDLEKALQMSLDSVLCDTAVPEGPIEPELQNIRQKLEKRS